MNQKFKNNYIREGRHIILSEWYPISFLFIVKKSLFWVLLFTLSGTLLTWQILSGGELITFPYSDFSTHSFLLASTAIFGIVAVCKLFYYTLYCNHYYYGIEAGHLVISKGIFLKHRGLFPLSRITDVYLDRQLGDFCFGLCDLHFSTPTVHSGKFARIDGLSIGTGIALQESLTNLLEALEPTHLADEQLRSSMAEENGKVKTFPPLRAAARA